MKPPQFIRDLRDSWTDCDIGPTTGLPGFSNLSFLPVLPHRRCVDSLVVIGRLTTFAASNNSFTDESMNRTCRSIGEARFFLRSASVRLRFRLAAGARHNGLPQILGQNPFNHWLFLELRRRFVQATSG